MSDKIKCGVIFGGQSSEYSVSLHSAGSFLKEIDSEKYDLFLIGITKDGKFYQYTGDIDHIEHDKWQEDGLIHPIAWCHEGFVVLDEANKFVKLDIAFPILHGKHGEDGGIQGLLEMMDIRYVGDDILGSAMNMDKEIMHIVCRDGGVDCAEYICLHEGRENPSFEEIKELMPLPWVVKPCSAGSSYGVHFVENKEEFEEACKDAFKYDGRGKILVEKAVEGFEIGCAVMGNEDLFAGSVDEIQIAKGIFDFDGKYEMNGAEIFCPARIDEETFEKAREFAKKAYRVMNCQGLARVDMFLQPDNTIVLNEINTIPGFTATSRYPTMMEKAGLPFRELIDRLIELGMERDVTIC